MLSTELVKLKKEITKLINKVHNDEELLEFLEIMKWTCEKLKLKKDGKLN